MVYPVGLPRSLPIPALLASVALALSGLTAPAAAAAPPTDQAPVLQSPATVTLLTGEHVTLRPGQDGKPQVNVQSRDGGSAVGYAIRNDHGPISVIPHDVASLVPGVPTLLCST
jgi:hypothetical protein